MTVTIDQAGPDEAAAVATIVEQAYAPYVALIGRRPAPMDADYARHVADGDVYVARRAGQPVGMSVLKQTAEALWLETVAVAPEHQGAGIGRRLITHAEAAARSCGLSRVRLYTNAAMHANLRLYPRLGYVETGRRRQHGFDRVFFDKMLAARA